MSAKDDLDALAAYESDDEDTKAPAPAAGDVKKAGGDYTTTIHASGFKDFLLKPELLWAITDCGFEHPSEVQHECIQQALLGTDVICQAKSGMGKTAVFVLAVLQQLDTEREGVQCLVMCHTRELAFQICHEFAPVCQLRGSEAIACFRTAGQLLFKQIEHQSQ